MGALLLIAVLTLALVIPAVDGRQLPGSGVMIKLPDRPKIGDCVLPSPIDIGASVGDPLDLFGRTSAACDDGTVAGEVVAVMGPTASVPARLDDVSADEINCRRSALEYSGLILEDNRALATEPDPARLINWDLVPGLRAASVVPSPLLRSAGQDWRACIAAPVGDTPYQGRLAGAFTGGRLPDEFGVCGAAQRPSVLLDAVPCSNPHLAELLATASVPGGGRTAVADIEHSCSRIAARVVGRSDPTAAGQLLVQTSISPAAGEFLALPQPQDVMCYISFGMRPLSGTLVGLGERPIPFAP